MNDVATIQQQYQRPAPTALDYGGLAMSGVGTIANIYSAIQAERESKKRLQMEEDQRNLQNMMAQQQVERQIQSQNRALPMIQNQESMNSIQNLLNLYNQGNRSSVVGA